MKSRNSNLGYHLVAFVTVAIWGSTFVFTKMLLQNGLSPAQIFTLRFIIAYILLLAFTFLRDKVTFSPPESEGVRGGLKNRSFRLFAASWRDEFLMVLLGITGGSVYFLAENAAMLYTTATNTSLIVCSCPLFAMLLFAIVYRHSERITKFQALGSIIACLGMAVVVLNGHFVLHLSPLGDMLAFAACLCWAVYSLLIKYASERYSSLFITRKVFIYGLLTIIPYFILRPSEATIFSFSIFNFQLSIILNLLFLSVVASMLCYIMWNWVISKLGAVVATNWVYFNPITTIIFAWWLLHEQITVWFLLGSALILIGMYLADRKK
ncbi:MAG: DMT family transporter [Prevotella sp.]|nr:DMT family transporter [Prevotella sp.]